MRWGGRLAFVAALSTSAATFAAPPASPPPRPEEDPRDGEPAAPAASVAPADELGAPPTPAVDAGKTKLSPLTPAPNEFPSGLLPPPPAELDRLLGDIAALRGRVAALTTTLFKSRLRVVVEARGAEARIQSLSVGLDDGVVFAAPERFSAEDERVVYEHAVAPGQHVLGLDVERYDARGSSYRSWQSSRFSLVVPEGKTVEAHFVIEDGSDMAEGFPDDGDGEYELEVRLRARVAP